MCDTDKENRIIWCIFSDKVGSITQNNSEKKHSTISKAVPIVRISEQVKLKVDEKQYTFKRSQFPLVLVYAITSHSSQGITKNESLLIMVKRNMICSQYQSAE